MFSAISDVSGERYPSSTDAETLSAIIYVITGHDERSGAAKKIFKSRSFAWRLSSFRRIACHVAYPNTWGFESKARKAGANYVTARAKSVEKT